jgi:PAS domain S-box-containing protein
MASHESPPDATFRFTTDASGIITCIGPEVYHVLGYKPEELIGRPLFDIIASGPVRRSALVRDALTGKKPFECLAVAMACRDGQIVEAGISSYPFAETGAGTGCNGIVRRAPGQPLPPEAAGDNGSEAELFLDLVCHDLNNINQIEAGYIELAMQSIGPESEVYGHLERCLSAIEIGSSLIHNVQKLHQISTGTRTIEKVDPGHILSEVIKYYEGADNRGIIFNYKLTCSCQVMANELLKDAFLNIIGNAIRHSPGVPVIDILIGETTEGEEKRCVVSIEDNGPGIPDDLKERLFKRFQSGNTSTSGKGLGLYLVKKLVEGFHGTVWVEDRVPGDYRKGSRFVIVLPAADSRL